MFYSAQIPPLPNLVPFAARHTRKQQRTENVLAVIHDLRNVLNALSGMEKILAGAQNLSTREHTTHNTLTVTAETVGQKIASLLAINEAETQRMTFEDMPQQGAAGPEAEITRDKILVVEDEPSNILVITTFLENLGYEYEIATDGREALNKVRDNTYSLILMDVGIPLIDGLTITRELRRLEQQGKAPPIPIIATTAHALIEHRQQCLDVGMNDYISKPFSESELRQKVETNLQIHAA